MAKMNLGEIATIGGVAVGAQMVTAAAATAAAAGAADAATAARNAQLVAAGEAALGLGFGGWLLSGSRHRAIGAGLVAAGAMGLAGLIGAMVARAAAPTPTGSGAVYSATVSRVPAGYLAGPSPLAAPHVVAGYATAQ